MPPKKNGKRKPVKRNYRRKQYVPRPIVKTETYKNTISCETITLTDNNWHVAIIPSMCEWFSSHQTALATLPGTAEKNVARGLKLNLLNTLVKQHFDASKLGTTLGQVGVDSAIQLQQMVGWCKVPINLQKVGALSANRSYEVDGQNYFANLKTHVQEAIESFASDGLEFGQAGMIKSFVKKNVLLRPRMIHNHDAHLAATNKFPSYLRTYKWNTSKQSEVQLSQPSRTASAVLTDTRYNMFMGKGNKYIPFWAYRIPGTVVPGQIPAEGGHPVDNTSCITISGNSRSYYKDD